MVRNLVFLCVILLLGFFWFQSPLPKSLEKQKSEPSIPQDPKCLMGVRKADIHQVTGLVADFFSHGYVVPASVRGVVSLTETDATGEELLRKIAGQVGCDLMEYKKHWVVYDTRLGSPTFPPQVAEDPSKTQGSLLSSVGGNMPTDLDEAIYQTTHDMRSRCFFSSAVTGNVSYSLKSLHSIDCLTLLTGANRLRVRFRPSQVFVAGNPADFAQPDFPWIDYDAARNIRMSQGMGPARRGSVHSGSDPVKVLAIIGNTRLFLALVQCAGENLIISDSSFFADSQVKKIQPDGVLVEFHNTHIEKFFPIDPPP